MSPPPRVSRLPDIARYLLLAAVAALLVSGHTNAAFDTFEITVNFYTTSVVEGESHSGYATTTLPFSYVDWYVNGAHHTTDYATSDTQTTSYFSHDYAGLGSEAGSEVTVRAVATHLTLSSAPSDEENVIVKKEVTLPPVAHPWIESDASCESKGWAWWPFDDEHHEMEVEVRPTHNGNPNGVPGYHVGKSWDGEALVSIHLTRDGRCKGCSANGGFFLPNAVCDKPINSYERPPNTNAKIAAKTAAIADNAKDLSEKHKNDHSVEVFVQLLAVTKVDGSQTFSGGVEVFVNLGFEQGTDHLRVGMLGWWASDPVNVSSPTLKGLPGEMSPFKGWIPSVAGNTKGVAKGSLETEGGALLSPESSAEHICPDGDTFMEDTCEKDNSKSGQEETP